MQGTFRMNNRDLVQVNWLAECIKVDIYVFATVGHSGVLTDVVLVFSKLVGKLAVANLGFLIGV